MNADTIAHYTTSVIAVLVIIGVIVLLVLGVAIPVELWTGFGLILGFFFGNQTGAARARVK